MLNCIMCHKVTFFRKTLSRIFLQPPLTSMLLLFFFDFFRCVRHEQKVPNEVGLQIF